MWARCRGGLRALGWMRGESPRADVMDPGPHAVPSPAHSPDWSVLFLAEPRCVLRTLLNIAPTMDQSWPMR